MADPSLMAEMMAHPSPFDFGLINLLGGIP
jgi:hypothetical protein